MKQKLLLKRSFVLFAIFLLTQSVLYSTEYHVDINNTGDQNGSLENPFTTIKQATDVMRAGDICYIHEGIYRETFNPSNSGNASSPITYTNYQNERVIISAVDLVTEWTKHSGNIYKASDIDLTLGKKNNVYCFAKKMQLARWPNNSDKDEYTLDAKYIDKTNGTYSNSYISNNEIPNIDWTGGVLHFLGAHSGCSWARTIQSYSNTQKRVYFEQLPDKWPFSTHSPIRYENKHRGIFYLLNKLEALDAPREWYYNDDTNTLYFYAPNGMNPEDAYVEVAKRDYAATIRPNYIHVSNINFFGGGIKLWGNHNKFSNIRVKHAGESIVLDNTNASSGEGAMMFLNADNNMVENCVFEDGAMNGIYMLSTSTGNTIKNCVIKDFNKVGLHVSLIRCGGTNNKFLNNTITGSARDGIYITGDNCEFGYNRVSSCLRSGADGGLFYVTGQSIPKNIEVHHNWFHDAQPAPHAGKKTTCIYLDNNSAGYIVHHNVVWDVNWGGLHFNWNAIENEVYNNTFWDVGPEDQSVIDCWVPMVNGTRSNVKDNILYNNLTDDRVWWSSGDGSNYRVDGDEVLDNVFENNMKSSTDIFESYATQNFVPKAGSAVLDQGKIITGYTDDYTGSAPDVGAYEHGGTQWIPGVDWEPATLSWLPDGITSSHNNLHYDAVYKLYPNPVRNLLNIESSSTTTYKIHSINGNAVMAGDLVVGHNKIDLAHIPEGIYIVNIKDGKHYQTPKVLRK